MSMLLIPLNLLGQRAELSGISRVVDYNHRQRREVQMDLFAESS